MRFDMLQYAGFPAVAEQGLNANLHGFPNGVAG